jgi:hypothetical protein
VQGSPGEAVFGLNGVGDVACDRQHLHDLAVVIAGKGGEPPREPAVVAHLGAAPKSQLGGLAIRQAQRGLVDRTQSLAVFGMDDVGGELGVGLRCALHFGISEGVQQIARCPHRLPGRSLHDVNDVGARGQDRLLEGGALSERRPGLEQVGDVDGYAGNGIDPAVPVQQRKFRCQIGVFGTVGVRGPFGEEPSLAAISDLDVVRGEVLGRVAAQHIDHPLADQLTRLAPEHGVGGRISEDDPSVEVIGVDRNVGVGEYAVHQPVRGLQARRLRPADGQLAAQSGELLLVL